MSFVVVLFVIVKLLGVAIVLFLLSGIRWIPNTKVGVVEMRISGRGSVKSGDRKSVV